MQISSSVWLIWLLFCHGASQMSPRLGENMWQESLVENIQMIAEYTKQILDGDSQLYLADPKGAVQTTIYSEIQSVLANRTVFVNEVPNKDDIVLSVMQGIWQEIVGSSYANLCTRTNSTYVKQFRDKILRVLDRSEIEGDLHQVAICGGVSSTLISASAQFTRAGCKEECQKSACSYTSYFSDTEKCELYSISDNSSAGPESCESLEPAEGFAHELFLLSLQLLIQNREDFCTLSILRSQSMNWINEMYILSRSEAEELLKDIENYRCTVCEETSRSCSTATWSMISNKVLGFINTLARIEKELEATFSNLKRQLISKPDLKAITEEVNVLLKKAIQRKSEQLFNCQSKVAQQEAIMPGSSNSDMEAGPAANLAPPVSEKPPTSSVPEVTTSQFLETLATTSTVGSTSTLSTTASTTTICSPFLRRFGACNSATSPSTSRIANEATTPSTTSSALTTTDSSSSNNKIINFFNSKFF